MNSGAALQSFRKMVEAQGGDLRAIDHVTDFHSAGASKDFVAHRSGVLAEMDCAQVGWAVQRLGAGREFADDVVDPHAGVRFHAKCGSRVKAGDAICTMFAAGDAKFEEPERLLRSAIKIEDADHKAKPLIRRIITIGNAAQFLKRH